MKMEVEEPMRKKLTSLLAHADEQQQPQGSTPESYINLAKQAATRQENQPLFLEAVTTSDLEKLKKLLPDRNNHYMAKPLLPAARQVLTEAIERKDEALQQKAIAALAWLTAVCAEQEVASLANFQVERFLQVDALTAYSLFKEMNTLVPSIKFPPKTINNLFWRLKRSHLKEAMQLITNHLGTNVFAHKEVEQFIQDLIERKEKESLVTFLETAMKAEQQQPHKHVHKLTLWDSVVKTVSFTGKQRRDEEEGEGKEEENNKKRREAKELLKRLFWAAEENQVSLSSLLTVWQALKEKGSLQECDKETVSLLKGYSKYKDLSKAKTGLR